MSTQIILNAPSTPEHTPPVDDDLAADKPSADGPSLDDTGRVGGHCARPSLLMRAKNAIAYLRAHKKELFWYWIAYQAIKGTITTSVIWLPLIYVWIGRG